MTLRVSCNAGVCLLLRCCDDAKLYETVHLLGSSNCQHKLNPHSYERSPHNVSLHSDNSFSY